MSGMTKLVRKKHLVVFSYDCRDDTDHSKSTHQSVLGMPGMKMFVNARGRCTLYAYFACTATQTHGHSVMSTIGGVCHCLGKLHLPQSHSKQQSIHCSSWTCTHKHTGTQTDICTHAHTHYNTPFRAQQQQHIAADVVYESSLFSLQEQCSVEQTAAR